MVKPTKISSFFSCYSSCIHTYYLFVIPWSNISFTCDDHWFAHYKVMLHFFPTPQFIVMHIIKSCFVSLSSFIHCFNHFIFVFILHEPINQSLHMYGTGPAFKRWFVFHLLFPCIYESIIFLAFLYLCTTYIFLLK